MTLPAEVLRRARGVVFDMDDTITRRGRIEATALEGIERLAEAGLERVLVTGRPLGWAEVAARLLPVSLALGENGAGWFDHEGREGYFEDAATRAEHAARLDELVGALRDAMPDVVPADDSRHRRCDRAFDVGERVTLDPARVDALVAFIRARGFHCNVSTVHCHAWLGGWDKAKGAARAMQWRGWEFDADEWIFIGDSGNDAPAFAAFPHSVGVANVRLDALPVAPAWVTPSPRGRGFRELVEAILEVR